ncbi:MarR family winged helix-turn-helix transcriptional regulator [Aestuariibius sp. 2305UL40-4]|uniref:MarR family winged helix-turn-helix transcriptional regulator n=1 Tax=Aestuariibius violaceus TaxID=3234132 RepID=UPI00345E229B
MPPEGADVSGLQASVATILRVMKITETSFRVAHRELNFSPPDLQSLRFIAQNPGCRSGELAAYLGVVPTTATSVVDRLVKRGLVSRTRPESDRRSVALTLTEDGREAFARIDAEEKQTMRVMLDALPDADREGFVRAMAQIAEHVSKIR